MYISVRVLAKQKRESVEAVGPNRLKIAVKEPAERNLANTRVRQLVAAHLKLPLAKVRLISGHTSPSKLFSVNN